MAEDMQRLYVTGMFRSGTTTLSRALNTHPEIAFASDPFLDLFKILRSDVAAELGQLTLHSPQGLHQVLV